MNYLNKKKIGASYKNLNSWFFAIAIAILVYALIFLLFTSATKAERNHTTVLKPQIIMLPLNKRNSPIQKQLAYWLRDDNPTLIVQPNNNYGYSSILNPEHKLSIDNASFNINSILAPQYFFSVPFKIYPITVEKLTPAQLFSQLDLRNNPNLPAIPFSRQPIPKLKYPYIKEYYSGTLVPAKFNNREKLQKLIEKYTPQKPTVLTADIPMPHRPLYFPIVKIISSCGFSELDKEAMNSLIIANLSKEKLLQGKQVKVYVEWQQNNKTINNFL